LELQEGYLGRAYWRQISELLKEAAAFRQRALAAEDQLRRKKAKSRRTKTPFNGSTLEKEIKRLAAENSNDVARMQKVLLNAGKGIQVDSVVSAWLEYSGQIKKVWHPLPTSDDELLLMLLSSIGP